MLIKLLDNTPVIWQKKFNVSVLTLWDNLCFYAPLLSNYDVINIMQNFAMKF